MGLIFVVLLLTLIMSIRLKYRIDWLYTVLVLSVGLNISYFTGLGPQFTARFFPWIGSSVWIVLLGLFNIISIYYIEEFSELSVQYIKTKHYFRESSTLPRLHQVM